MSHSDTIYMGNTQSSYKEVSNYAAAVASFPAGTCVRLKSDGTISKAKADGGLLGISLGRSLSDTNFLAVCRAGLLVPILLTDDEAEYAYVVKGAAVWIDDVSGIANIEDTGAVTTTVSNAIYASEAMDGIAEDGTTAVKVALIDMQGGV